MSYTLLTGSFVIRYPDLPRAGPEPDGDTVKFAPGHAGAGRDAPAPVGPRCRTSTAAGSRFAWRESTRSRRTSARRTRSWPGANAARDELLGRLGFTDVDFFDDLPNKIESADQDSVRGHVLSNGIDANGRMIGFVYAGDQRGPTARGVFVDEALRRPLGRTPSCLRAGHAYPAFYATLPAALRTHLAALSRAARDAGRRGLWARSTADPDGAAEVADLDALEQLVIWPKLFRRIVPYLAAGFAELRRVRRLAASRPVDRDDELFLLDRLERGNLHDVVRASGDSIAADALARGVHHQPRPAVAGGARRSLNRRPAATVLFVAALPDAAGADSGSESVTAAQRVLSHRRPGRLGDRRRRRRPPSPHGSVLAGATTRNAARRRRRAGQPRRHDPAPGRDRSGDRPGRLPGNQVRAGRTIAFGR